MVKCFEALDFAAEAAVGLTISAVTGAAAITVADIIYIYSKLWAKSVLENLMLCSIDFFLLEAKPMFIIFFCHNYFFVLFLLSYRREITAVLYYLEY